MTLMTTPTGGGVMLHIDSHSTLNLPHMGSEGAEDE